MKFGKPCCAWRNPRPGSNIERLPCCTGIDNEKAIGKLGCFRHQMLLSRTRKLILNRERCCRVDEREHDLERCQKDYFRAEDLPHR
jgi:hypothetical protein